MDPKKQDLTPELKQIYDRVMNTQVKNPPAAPGAASTPPAAGQTPATPAPAQPAAATPPAPTTNLGALNANKPADSSGATHDTFLSSAPPRPLNDDKSFVFTGNKVTTPNGTTPTAAASPAKGGAKPKLSPPIIGAIVVVGVIVWGVVWAKIFGLF